MKTRYVIPATVKKVLTLATTFSVLHSTLLMAQLSRQWLEQTDAKVEHIQTALDKYQDSGQKMEFLQESYAQATNEDVRPRILMMAEKIGGDGYEKMLITTVESDKDVGMRITAAHQLGIYGTSRSIDPLLKCAESEVKQPNHRGDIVISEDARRIAYFALADIGLRLPSERQRIVTGIRGFSTSTENDEKTEVLFILTGDTNLLRPFYERMTNADPRIAVSGVTAFRSLKLKQATEELIKQLGNSNPAVRNWVAFVLGEIGDPHTIPLLVNIANDRKEDKDVMLGAIVALGKMHAKDATTALQQIISVETNDVIKVQAAIALSKITGVRHPLVPDGYPID